MVYICSESKEMQSSHRSDLNGQIFLSKKMFLIRTKQKPRGCLANCNIVAGFFGQNIGSDGFSRRFQVQVD